jgi:hypothetical protein
MRALLHAEARLKAIERPRPSRTACSTATAADAWRGADVATVVPVAAAYPTPQHAQQAPLSTLGGTGTGTGRGVAMCGGAVMARPAGIEAPPPAKRPRAAQMPHGSAGGHSDGGHADATPTADQPCYSCGGDSACSGVRAASAPAPLVSGISWARPSAISSAAGRHTTGQPSMAVPLPGPPLPSGGGVPLRTHAVYRWSSAGLPTSATAANCGVYVGVPGAPDVAALTAPFPPLMTPVGAVPPYPPAGATPWTTIPMDNTAVPPTGHPHLASGVPVGPPLLPVPVPVPAPAPAPVPRTMHSTPAPAGSAAVPSVPASRGQQ